MLFKPPGFRRADLGTWQGTFYRWGTLRPRKRRDSHKATQAFSGKAQDKSQHNWVLLQVHMVDGRSAGFLYERFQEEVSGEQGSEMQGGVVERVGKGGSEGPQ